MTQAEQITQYGAPTWKQQARACDQWREWKSQAARLDTAELRRHASVSTGNAHECVNCFCCAALDVLREREG